MHFAFYEQRGEYEVALLFGAGVRGSRLSPILEDRAMTAFQLFDSGKIKKILISADNSSPEYDEVRPTRDFLIAQGVKSGAIYLDFAGFDSYDSLYRAKEIF
jgi:SanA protein